MAKVQIKEAEIQRAILQYLQVQENMGKLMFQRSNSLNVATKSGHYVKTGKKGSPDILVWVNKAFDGFDYFVNYAKTLALEVKSESGILSPEQKIWRDKFEKLGGEYYIVRNVDDVIKILKE